MSKKKGKGDEDLVEDPKEQVADLADGVAAQEPAAGDEPGPTEDTGAAAVAAPAAEGDSATAKADELALLGRMDPLERAMHHWGLERRHVMGSKVIPQDDGSVQVVIVTHGGQRVRWPQDAGRVLSDMEKGDAVPHAQPAGIFRKA